MHYLSNFILLGEEAASNAYALPGLCSLLPSAHPTPLLTHPSLSQHPLLAAIPKYLLLVDRFCQQPVFSFLASSKKDQLGNLLTCSKIQDFVLVKTNRKVQLTSRRQTVFFLRGGHSDVLCLSLISHPFLYLSMVS